MTTAFTSHQKNYFRMNKTRLFTWLSHPLKRMRSTFIICLLLSACIAVAQTEKPDTSFHIYLLIGQSNMAGRGAVDSISKKENPQILMLNKENNWVPATDPLHFDKPAIAGVGPGLSFAQNMLDNNKNIKIGLIPCALGGSPIRVWVPDSIYLETFHPYDDAIRRSKIAMQRGVLKGIIWHQGESDNSPQNAAIYMDKLKALILRLRTDLQLPNLPFVAGELGYFLKDKFINNIIGQLPQQVSNTAVVSAEGLTDKGDQLHFNTSSARELGKRYAEAMKQLQAASQH